MILKGLPDSFQSFVAVITQSEEKQNVTEFKVALRSFEETERSRVQSGDSVLKTLSRAPRPSTNCCTSRTGMSDTQNPSTCFKCGQAGHFAKNCKQRKLWCSYCKKNNHTDKSCTYLRNKVGSGRNNVDRVNEVVGTKKVDSTEHSFAFGASTPDGKILGRANTWLVDCGATTHIINDERMFSKFDASFQQEKHFIELANGEKHNNIALKREVNFMIMDTSGKCVKACLKNALFVPTFPHNIFSVQAATERGASVHFKADSAELVYNDGTKFNIEKHGKLYYLRTCDLDNGQTDDSVNYASDLKGWHEILGHCNYDDVMNVERVVDGMQIVDKSQKPVDCDVCIQGKTTNDSSKKPRVK